MRIFGLLVPFTGERRNALGAISKALSAVTMGSGWIPLVREIYSGAWQRNVTIDTNAVQAFHAVFRCKTLIASDIAKLGVNYIEEDENGIWVKRSNSAYDPVLRRPNAYQNRIQFWENWMLSKLSSGNTYVLKGRDARGVVNALYVLDSNRVTPLISDDGDVFYRLASDNLAGLNSSVIVPAREIIHDRMNCMFHPLIGVPPLFASGRAAQQGLNIQNNSIRLFENNSSPGGILTAPGEIHETTAKRLKDDWELNFSGKNIGRVAVLGDGLKFEKMVLTAVEGQLIEQLKQTAEVVCSSYGVPPFKIGMGEVPKYDNIQALNVQYYSQCLQIYIESAELCLDEGLEIGSGKSVAFDDIALLRMDTLTQATVEKELVGAGIKAPNEARRTFDLGPKKGGDSPYLQNQNFSLEALAKRDAQDDPFAKTPPATSGANDNNPAKIAEQKYMELSWRRELRRRELAML